ncbi:hypothetical protein PENTCL1PPCAC_13807 [Pristionchus entomophagus]|uniref:Uncharacterized protein n=1 Tax=Pristionchus entomophagus TaxID=358040 RepID=A0AAV5T7S3_9BILA|nr:hypothetical protein PENTCL1PPCAC_13807 [Pristionchus entomophagus]
MPFPSLPSSLASSHPMLPLPLPYQDPRPSPISPLSQMSSRRRSLPKKTGNGQGLEPIRWVPGRQTAVRDVKRGAWTRERRENHHNNQIGRTSVVCPPAPSIVRRDSAYSSEEEAERTLFAVDHRQENEYANVPVRATGRRMSAADTAAAWDDPAEEVDLDFSLDDEDDVKPIGDKIPVRHDGASIWDHPIPVHLRSLITRRPSILTRSTTILKDHGIF